MSPHRAKGAVDADASAVYKVVEVPNVTGEDLEETINHWVAQGYRLDGIQFAMRESSRRPSMAFVIFTQGHAASRSKTAGGAP